MSDSKALNAPLAIVVALALSGVVPKGVWAGDEPEFPRVSMIMQCQMGGDQECLEVCGKTEDYNKDACVAAFNKFRKSKPEPATMETETEIVDTTADSELRDQLAYYKKECMRHTASVADLLNKTDPDGPKHKNSLREHYHYAKDQRNPLADRKEAMKTALEICETMRSIQGG